MELTTIETQLGMTLKEALKIILKDECIGDYIYSVRANASETDVEYQGSSWDHPRVTAFSAAVDVLETIYEAL